VCRGLDQDLDIGFLSGVTGPRRLDKAADVTVLADLFEDLRSLALPRADSLDFTEQLGRRLYGM
jgi:hypothetical protein